MWLEGVGLSIPSWKRSSDHSSDHWSDEITRAFPFCEKGVARETRLFPCLEIIKTKTEYFCCINTSWKLKTVFYRVG